MEWLKYCAWGGGSKIPLSIVTSVHLVPLSLLSVFKIIIEYKVGGDLKDYLVQCFMAKARSGQDGPAPCPARFLCLS